MLKNLDHSYSANLAYWVRGFTAKVRKREFATSKVYQQHSRKIYHFKMKIYNKNLQGRGSAWILCECHCMSSLYFVLLKNYWKQNNGCFIKIYLNNLLNFLPFCVVLFGVICCTQQQVLWISYRFVLCYSCCGFNVFYDTLQNNSSFKGTVAWDGFFDHPIISRKMI